MYSQTNFMKKLSLEATPPQLKERLYFKAERMLQYSENLLL